MLERIKMIRLLLLTIMSFTVIANEYPLTVQDDMGNTLTFDAQPQRISSKTLFSDEVLFELIEPQRFTSVTSLASNKAFSNIADKLPKEIAQLDLQVEQIIANQPQVVFVANWSDAGKIQQLKNAGLQVYLIQTPVTLAQIKQSMRNIARLVGEQSAVEQVIAQMDAKLQREVIMPIRNKSALDHNAWAVSNTKNSTWHILLTHAHVDNAAASLVGDSYGQVAMSKEQLIILDPELIFVPQGSEQTSNHFIEQTFHDPALQRVRAVKNKQIFPIPEKLRATYSHYIVDAIIYVNHQAYRP